MPRFPFLSYLLRHRHRHFLRRIQDIRRANSIDLAPLIFREISPAGNGSSYPRARSLSSNGDALYVSVADPLAARRYISFHDSVVLTVPGSFCSDTSCSVYKLSSCASYLSRKKKLYGTTTKGCSCMRTWVASMDRFDVLVDAGNSPLLPSTTTRYRSRRASVSSGLAFASNKLDLSFFDRERSFLPHLLSLALLSFSFSTWALTFPSWPLSPPSLCRSALSRSFVFISRAPAGSRSVYIKQDKRKSFPKETSLASALGQTGRKFDSMVWKFSYSI